MATALLLIGMLQLQLGYAFAKNCYVKLVTINWQHCWIGWLTICFLLVFVIWGPGPGSEVILAETADGKKKATPKCWQL